VQLYAFELNVFPQTELIIFFPTTDGQLTDLTIKKFLHMLCCRNTHINLKRFSDCRIRSLLLVSLVTPLIPHAMINIKSVKLTIFKSLGALMQRECCQFAHLLGP
jgi:hypothetical protein